MSTDFCPVCGSYAKGIMLGKCDVWRDRDPWHDTPYKSEGKTMIFVFGSNEAGIHGAGAAKVARMQHGAILMQGVGRQGNAYAIPSKGKIMHRGQWSIGNPLPIQIIANYVDEFIAYAIANPELDFQVTQIGCGHAGFTSNEMAPLFVNCPGNCLFDTAWKPWLGADRRYWGTYQ